MSDADKPQHDALPGNIEQKPQPSEPGQQGASEQEMERPTASRLRQLDKELEAELEAAMGGLTAADLYGDPASAQRPDTETGGRKKGHVMSVRGSDVFVSVPGERSQGVLPITQFSEGSPQPGTEVEFDVEGYD